MIQATIWNQMIETHICDWLPQIILMNIFSQKIND